MADVTFRRGVEANLPTSGMATEGCVYQSTDTGNMYVGSSQGTLIPVNRSPYYGTCATQASTNAKVVTLDVDDDNFTMKAGVMISVLFSNENTAASPTLNVNSKGAVSVKSYGTTNVSASPRAWEAGEVVTFVHNGSYWMMVGHKVQSDWNQTDNTAVDFIKNKPTNVSAFTNDAGYITTNDIPEGAAASTTTPKMDGVAEIGSELAFARGDHRHPSDTNKQDKLTAGTDLEIVETSPRLPSGYTELEYLESSGSQRIDIGSSLDASKDDVEITFQLTDTSFASSIFGARYTTTSRAYTFGNRYNGYYGCGWGTSTPNTETEVDTLKHTVKIEHEGGIFKLDGSSIYTFGNSSITTPTTATLFAIHTTSGTSYYYSKVRIFEFKMWRDGVLVKHYVPCKNQNDVLGMYDLVASSNQFKQKDSGSDDFIAGSAVLFGKTINFTNDSGFITSADLPSPADTAPLMDGTSAVGSSTDYAREDHVHPTDTSRAPLASPSFTGTPTAPTASAGTNTTQIATTAFVNNATSGLAVDANVVHKTGNENIGGTKTFSSNVVLGTNANLVLGSAQDEGVYMEANSSSGGQQVLIFSSIEDDSAVRLENVATPVNNTDVANKIYVDDAVGNTYVSLNGVADTYGILPYSLCAFAFTAYPSSMAMTSFTTSGGTGSKTPITDRWFPIGCKIYYHYSGTASSGSFTSKRFYSTYNGVNARYSAVTGTNVSLSSGKAVYLMVEANANGLWKPFYKSGETNEIIVTDTISAGHFYIYLGRAVGSTGYMFQLEDNNPLYACVMDGSGTHLVDWATYNSSRTPYLVKNIQLFPSSQFQSNPIIGNTGIYSRKSYLDASYLEGVYKVTLQLHAWWDYPTGTLDTPQPLSVIVNHNTNDKIAGGTFIIPVMDSPNDANYKMGTVVVNLTGFVTFTSAQTYQDYIEVKVQGAKGINLGGEHPLCGENEGDVEYNDGLILERIDFYNPV